MSKILPRWYQRYLPRGPEEVITHDWNITPWMNRFTDDEQSVVGTLPDSKKLMWYPDKAFFSMTWYQNHSPVLRQLGIFDMDMAIAGKRYIAGFIPTFQVNVAYMPGSCAMLLLDHIESVYNEEQTTALLNLVMASHRDTGHLYLMGHITSSESVETRVIKKIGRKVATFGNPTHEYLPVSLWLLSTDLKTIDNPQDKGIFA